MTIDELYERCMELATATPSLSALRFMHETLVLCCAEGLKDAGTGFGNLFSQVDFLCKRCGMKTADRIGVQQMRRRSNRSEVPDAEQWLDDLRTLVLFISAVFKADIPDGLVQLIPHHAVKTQGKSKVNARYLRCIVGQWDEQTIHADTADGSHVTIAYSGHEYLRKMLRQGMQLNLLDSRIDDSVVQPGIVVVEPDFLLDISTVARCFQAEYGHHPLLYTIERLRPRTNTQAILLGNFAGSALDDIINDDNATLGQTMNRFFHDNALQFTTCNDFNVENFVADAKQQTVNIREAVDELFTKSGYDRSKALLEPTFVCEHLGLQGRVDMMTSDMKLLVEQKSGKNYNIERTFPGHSQSGHHKEDHYVQLLLYYGILRYNFGRTDNQVDIRLLYSRYPARQGLLYVNFYHELFCEAIRLRNRIVATEMIMAREGFGRIMPLLRPDVVYHDSRRDGHYYRYIEPPLNSLYSQLSTLSPTEQAYIERMMTFVYREQLLQKVGRQEGLGSAVSDLWNMPLTEKLETGNIILSDHPSPTLNFRRGDMVYLYNYTSDEPDVRHAILYKGTLDTIDGTGIKVSLNEGIDADDIMTHGKWAIEHAGSDQNTTSAIKSLYQFATASSDKRDLLLGLRTPRRDTTLQLSRHYNPYYDDVLLQSLQARDYFLLIGPPGTGKTSMALRFMVDETEGDLLLMSYTNRAVDEICAMLDDAGHDYLRIGNETSCDPRFKSHLIENTLGEKPKLDDIRERILSTRIIVGTTSILQARPFIFQLKHFSLAIVDEASQILEPGIVGLLASDRIDRFILIGDHKQLPAVVQQLEQESHVDNPLLNAIGITDCRHSLFERLLRWEQHCGRQDFIGILRRQGRMHPDIATFPNAMFYHKEQLEPVPLKHQTETTLGYDLPSEDETDDLLKQQRILFFDIQKTEGAGFSDKVNPAEARLVADLLRRVHRFCGHRFDAQHTVGVIVPYRNQITMIRDEIAKLNVPALKDISIDTVERFQGSQRDVIIYSFTVSRPYQLDFLTSNSFDEDGYTIDRKLNVAITRARKQLLMTGNAQLLRRNPIFERLILWSQGIKY